MPQSAFVKAAEPAVVLSPAFFGEHRHCEADAQSRVVAHTSGSQSRLKALLSHDGQQNRRDGPVHSQKDDQREQSAENDADKDAARADQAVHTVDRVCDQAAQAGRIPESSAARKPPGRKREPG